MKNQRKGAEKFKDPSSYIYCPEKFTQGSLLLAMLFAFTIGKAQVSLVLELEWELGGSTLHQTLLGARVKLLCS